MKPSIGRVVHYVSYGTPGGEYASECRAAVVTVPVSEFASRTPEVGLCVLNPTGMFFNESVVYNEGAEVSGDPDCQLAASHGSPLRYCQCGWSEATLRGGTWHWPERV